MTAPSPQHLARIEARKAELWIEAMEARQTWPFSAAVLWVGYRSMTTIEQWFRRGEGYFLDGMTELERIGTADDVVAADEKALEPLPKAALLVALSKGLVKGQGIYEPRKSLNPYGLAEAAEVEEIDPEIWYTHKLGPWYRLYLGWERARQPDEPFLLPADFKWRNEWDHPEPAWRKVEVDRPSLIATFPRDERSERAAQLDWWATEDVTQRYWCREDGPAEKEARRRLQAKGDKPSIAAILREMWRMWIECGRAPPDSDVRKGAASLKAQRAKA